MCQVVGSGYGGVTPVATRIPSNQVGIDAASTKPAVSATAMTVPTVASVPSAGRRQASQPASPVALGELGAVPWTSDASEREDDQHDTDGGLDQCPMGPRRHPSTLLDTNPPASGITASFQTPRARDRHQLARRLEALRGHRNPLQINSL